VPLLELAGAAVAGSQRLSALDLLKRGGDLESRHGRATRAGLGKPYGDEDGGNQARDGQQPGQ